MIVVWEQWQSEFMTVLLGDFEEELRRMPMDQDFTRPIFREFDAPSSARHDSHSRAT
jgi:hypothetical protein